MSGIEGANGSDAADTMIGDDRDNAFFQLFGGDDTVRLGGGDDFVDAGAGVDTLYGGKGFDSLSMFDDQQDQPRNDGVTVNLAAQTDSDADQFSGFESVGGSLGDDVLIGTDGPNGLFGADGSDTLTARGGRDLVDPGNGTDTATGGVGHDLLGNLDHYDGGLTVNLRTGTDSDGDTLAGFEDALGTFSDDILIGDAAGNSLLGVDGNDLLRGLAGADQLDGDTGTDRASGGLGTDRCRAETQHSCEYGLGRATLAGTSSQRFPLTARHIYRWPTVLSRYGQPLTARH